MPSQWETALRCNDVSHWIAASLESALIMITKLEYEKNTYSGFYMRQKMYRDEKIDSINPRKEGWGSFFFLYSCLWNCYFVIGLPGYDMIPVYIYLCKSITHIGVKSGICQFQGAVSIKKTVLPGMAIPMLKIRHPNGRLIFNMEITIRR